ncbi:uncharacterized mitochondrial protein-like protein [Tanacetum coccineum]|uniref:Uncharacterized mitochondrial protein-like protein n=1 Tax=Tanacetum coccineum TaxID=301880 RepID=A0ABQ5IQ04_9ASTR
MRTKYELNMDIKRRIVTFSVARTPQQNRVAERKNRTLIEAARTMLNAGQAGQEKASDHEYILLPLMFSNSPLSSSTSKHNDNDADEQRRTNHKDYQNCLFACFLSQIEPKKVIQALTDPSWIEAMQEELLQFKLQKVWTLVDLPKEKIMECFISQDKYVADILKNFDFFTVKTTSTPIETNKALLKDEEAEDVDVHLYRLMIGSLMYLTASRPDIMFVVCACARFQVTPKVSHLHAVKMIFRYLKDQPIGAFRS